MTVPVRRSGIPKVMGILMIIFGSLGLLSALSSLGSSNFDELRSSMSGEPLPGFDELERAEGILRIVGLIGLPISGLHLFAGIRAVQYKANAPRLSIFYAVSAAVHTTTATVVSYVVLLPAFDAIISEMPGDTGIVGVVRTSMQMFLIIGVMIGLIWPILVGVLMSRPAARDACAS